ncbi:LOW QUALITY PROTEIN: cilia- and flagella-associated protein 43-like [Phaenicophaeus curvirostris]|uniref:LOW QUALITY PROTEIN: cilia- and flagella-associated protein 43-like n=1 Tax=Phaenicophaeus curvirostris TaxID=33595 RepID=UPI0037F0CBC5
MAAEYVCKVSDIVSYVRGAQKKKGGKPEDPQQSVLFAVAFCNGGLYAAGNSVTISGEVQVWFLEDGTCLSKLNLDIQGLLNSKRSRILTYRIVVKKVLVSKGAALADEVLDLSVVSDFNKDLVASLRARLEVFYLPSELTTDNDEYVNDQGMFDASAIKQERYDLDCPLSSAVRLKDNIVYGYCTSGLFICKYHLTEKTISEDPSVFLSEKRIRSNQFGSGILCLSPNGRWLASAANDGVLFVYHTPTMDILARMHCHSYQGGGIRSTVFSLDSKFILVIGKNDGALVCLKWKKIKNTEAEEADLHWRSLLAILNKSTSNENTVLQSMAERHFDPESTAESLPEGKFKDASLKSSNVEVTEEDGNVTSSYSANTNEMTWIDQKMKKVIREETERFANQKKELQMGIKKLHETIQKMMHENELVADIEKLEQQEFNLDVEEQERAQEKAEEEVARVRKEIEMENLANCYLQSVIKHECWDPMCVKGRAVKCFHIASEVKNYPMKERTEEELKILEKVLQLKKIETADDEAQKKNPETESETVLPEEEREKTEDVTADDNASSCLIGSLSSQYGGDTSILYHQLDLHSREQKVNQIVLLKDIIYKLKTAFNKEFDIVAQQKEQEIERVKERNLRIREILEQLDLQLEVWEPALTDDEIPERALTVQDSEIKVEKYLTQEEREKAEMLAKLEMERRLAEKPRDSAKPSVHPTAHCWTATSEIYLGRKEGYVMAIDAERGSVSVLQQKPLPEYVCKVSDIVSYVRGAQKKKGGKPEDPQQSVLFAVAFCNGGLYAAGNGGVLFFYHIKDLQYETKICVDILKPISSLIFSPDYAVLLLVTDQGTIYAYKPAHSGEAVKLLDTCSSCFLTADFLTPGDKYCVSVTISGEVQVWFLEDGTCLSKLNLDIQATAMACCPSSSSVAVGTIRGQIYFLDVTKAEAPRVVHRIFLSKFPVLSLHYDQSGRFLITRAAEGHIFILDARPSKLFQVLGYVALADEVLDLSVVSDFNKDLVEVAALLNVGAGQRARLEVFYLPSELTTDNDEYVNDQGMFDASAIKQERYDLDCPLSSAVRLKDNIVYGYCTSGLFICKYHLTEKTISEDPSVFLSEKRIRSNQFGSGILCLSPNGRWLASAANDGVLFVYHTPTMDILARMHCHSYQGGGIRSTVFSLDSKFILVIGKNDGALVCLKWKKIKNTEAEEADLHWRSLLAILNKSTSNENTVLQSMAERHFDPESTAESLPEGKFKDASLKSSNVEVTEEDGNVTSSYSANTNEMTWIDQKMKKVIREETERFANQKKELQMGIKKLHETIQKMMHENELVADIEKLEQQEFNLDVEEQERAQEKAEEEVARVRKEIEMENLANCYLQSVIKHECWDPMCVKGRAVKCFHIASEVKNYPMKERTEEELKILEKVLQLKKIETADDEAQKKNPETESETVLPEEEREKTEDVTADDNASSCLIGSLSSQYGGDTSILYHQLDLHSREQKVNQIVLLKDIIYKLKTAFNKEFDIVAQQKEQEIERVKERNLRIREILEQLDLQLEVWEPALTDDEIPERALTVQDSEIKVEKYLTQEEREKAEMLAKLEMERRLAEKDNDRLRALNDMMGGVLEVKKEDVLKMDIPPPPFLSKPEHLWNEEEKRIFREYEIKVKELNEEKEEYRRALEDELKKLKASIQETTRNFDEIVCKLSERKVKSEMVIYQEELKIVNLVYALLLDEELDTRKAGLHNFLVKKEKEKDKTTKTLQTTEHKIVAYMDTYENAIVEEKKLECGFTKEFADLPADLLNELSQLYKRRPEAPVTEMAFDTANPYGNCSGSAEDYKDARTLLRKSMDELDSPEYMPNGLDPSIWERFCLARRNKMETEELVKQKDQTLAEMQAFLQRRMDDDEKIKSELEGIFQELRWVQEEKKKFQRNLTVQFLLKQGQVELESTGIPDYSDAILINRSVIEELNSSIMAQGRKKIASVVECKDFSKVIFHLEWEHKKMRMQIEDLEQKARDIATLSISKDRQLFLSMMNYDTHITHQISAMEQSLGIMDKLHKKNVKKRQKRIKELEKCISLEEQANYNLSLQLKEMLVSVSERRHIFEAADTQHISNEIAKQRYQEILKQKHLRDLVEEQEEQFETLQAEAERWRLRTFPIF